MKNTKNALAELAEELASLIPEDKDIRELDQRRWNVVDKAWRIVAELAKVKGLDEHGQTYLFYRDETQMAYEKCRKIAEEGTEDDE